MYSTCIFCRTSLGRNQQIEAFPIGQRLAFDTHRGRLWVVCRVCQRWNLTPLEQRWEAIEWCERTLRTHRPIAATDEIALFRLNSGLELVRIGSAPWREVAAWRYGKRIWWRHVRHQITRTTAQLVPFALGPLLLPGMTGLMAGSGLVLAAHATYLKKMGNRVAHFVPHGRRRATIRNFHLHGAVLEPAGNGAAAELNVRVRSDRGTLTLAGADALRVASLALVRANGEGGARQDIGYAIQFVADAGSGEAYFATMARRLANRRPRDSRWIGTLFQPENDFTGPIRRFPSLTRLALEIAAHEASEARALEGELAALVAAWRDAEEIATIADNLLLPAAVVRRWSQLRRTARGAGDAT